MLFFKSQMKEQERYNLRGVSASKEDVHKSIQKLDKGLFPFAFCKVTEDLFLNDPKFCTVMHADGAGTKSSLAYLYWKETGDISVWRGIAQDAIVMNTDDLICAGISDNIILSSLIGRNKFLIPQEVISEIIQGTEQFIEMLRSYGFNITLSGGETADVGDLVRTVVVDSVVVSRTMKNNIISNDNIKAGDVIIGLASYGRANYEEEYNSGIGSNGLTAARHEMFCKEYSVKYPESFDCNVPSELVYSGNFRLTDTYEKLPINIGKAVLSPTRTYLPVFNQIFDKYRNQIHGLIHCTGGAQTKVLNFIKNVHVIKNNMFEIPPVFELIQKQAAYNWKEMYKVFNMGHRMEIYLPEEFASEIIGIAESFGIGAKIIGYCEASEQKRLTISSVHGSFEY